MTAPSFRRMKVGAWGVPTSRVPPLHRSDEAHDPVKYGRGIYYCGDALGFCGALQKPARVGLVAGYGPI
jgi:hypothetical protein